MNTESIRLPQIHKLKIWPENYQLVKSYKKLYELRKNDRNFLVGDFLQLEEYDPKINEYTGFALMKSITHILQDVSLGLIPNYVILGLSIENVWPTNNIKQETLKV